MKTKECRGCGKIIGIDEICQYCKAIEKEIKENARIEPILKKIEETLRQNGDGEYIIEVKLNKYASTVKLEFTVKYDLPASYQK